MNKMKLKSLLVHIDLDLHCEIKKRAAMRGISMRTWVMRAVLAQIKQERKYEEKELQNSESPSWKHQFLSRIK